MIYDCPNCRTPQEAGRTSCPRCGAEFDGPVPEDAVLPPAEAAAETVPAEPISAETAPIETAPIETAPIETAPIETAPYVPPPYKPAPVEVVTPSEPPPTSVPPAYATGFTAAPQGRPASGGSLRALLIAGPIVLLLVLGGLFYAHTLDSDEGSTPAPMPSPRAALPAAPVTPSAAPVYLQGGHSSDAAADPQLRKLVGRWETKSSDFYVFNDDRTGSRGTLTGSQKPEPFLWTLVQNRLTLYSDTNVQLRFSPGPDDDTIFLRGKTGHFIQYTRAKTFSPG